jgi:hypothetical protein
MAQKGNVFDITAMKIIYRTKSNPRIREIGVSDFVFSAQYPVMVFNMEHGPEGCVSGLFSPYTRAENERIVKKSFAPVKKEFPENVQKDITIYPELLRIVEETKQ